MTHHRIGPIALAFVLVSGAALLDSCSSTQPAKEQVSDATITTKIKSKFVVDTEVNPFNISVETEEGTVYLTGRVNDESEKAQAERLALETDGVVRVINHIQVGDRT
jgi:hyperosmotically inducible protein